ncbi:MAG: phosphatidate cytidylyltransferase [Candidatus Promineifilaceae bacterium]|nr:phosphatidate cytidylyltransferase [Candidatus Promineifilaceae bacterium]
MSTLLQRAIIALTFGPLALFLIYLGGLFYAIPLAIVILLATVEFVQLTRRLGWRTSYFILLPIVFAFCVAGWWQEFQLIEPILLISLLVVLAYALWLYEVRQEGASVATWMAMIGGVLLLGWLGSYFFRLRGQELRIEWQWTMLAMVGTWIADSAAYMVGKFLAGNVLGKHPLSPRLSPNKTVEGYVGGIVLGTAVTLLIAHFLQLPLMGALILALLISVVSPLGDLGISLLKRQSGVKDSSTLFRSHGGALDRIDSLIWSVAMAFYVTQYF